MNKIFLAIVILSSLFLTSALQAQDGNQGLLISKLEKVLQNLADKDESKVSITLRLADLYSERARHDSMKEIENGCSGECIAGTADRTKALRLYTDVLPKVSEVNKSKVIVQVGHLYQMNGQEEKAIGFYSKVTEASQLSNELKSEAHLSLAEIYFKRRDYKKAAPHYQVILGLPQSNSKGLAAYRSAWCAFNNNDHVSAINQMENILSTPALLSKSSLNGDKSGINNQFHEEVSKDYATFLTQKKITTAEVQKLYKLSPETTRQGNIQYLAYELDRLGKKQESLIAWREAQTSMTSPEDKITGQLAQAQLNLDLQDKKTALTHFEKALGQMTDFNDLTKKCTQASSCDEYRKRARFFVVSWNQTEKKQASDELLQAYKLFLDFYKTDIEMKSYAVLAAMSSANKDKSMAWNLQQSVIDDLTAPLAKPETAKSVKSDVLEKNLVQQLDMADTMGTVEQKNQAYENYTKFSPLKTKMTEVMYQKAHQQYEKNNYAEAAKQFHQIALTKTADMKLRKQSADLALDSLGLMKDTANVAAYAQVYKTELGANSAKDFSQILQKTKLSESVEQANSNTSTSSAVAYETLSKINVSELEAADKVKFYKNKIILAEKNKKFSDAISAADALVLIPEASAEDKEFAFSRKAYLAELRLDFGTAFTATEKLAKTYTADEKNLKLAIFSELSGGTSETYYKKYLENTTNAENKKLVAVELVQKSKNKEQEIAKHNAILEKDPETLANLLAESYSSQNSAAIYKKISSSAALKKTNSGKLVLRSVFLTELKVLSDKISKHQLDPATDKKLVSSIKARKALLDQVEAQAQKAIESTDWSSQLVSLHMLSKQSERFYNDVISAPMPKGLTPEEESQYLSLLSAQAMPYKNKSVEAQIKVDEFWKSANWKSEFQKSLAQTQVRKLIETEVKAVSEIADTATQAELKAMLDTSVATAKAVKPTVDEVKKTRQMVYADPLSATALNALLDLEKRSENRAMVSYLENRIESLKKGL